MLIELETNYKKSGNDIKIIESSIKLSNNLLKVTHITMITALTVCKS